MFPRLDWQMQQLTAAGGDIPSPITRMQEATRCSTRHGFVLKLRRYEPTRDATSTESTEKRCLPTPEALTIAKRDTTQSAQNTTTTTTMTMAPPPTATHVPVDKPAQSLEKLPLWSTLFRARTHFLARADHRASGHLRRLHPAMLPRRGLYRNPK